MRPLEVKSEINVALLEQIKEQVLAHPEHVNMREWIHDGTLEEDETHTSIGPVAIWLGNPELFVNQCNTTACIAGWAAVLSLSAQTADAYSFVSIASMARGQLGLSRDQANRLFDLEDWPIRFAIKYEEAETAEAAALVVADRISHFIQTNGEE